MTEPNALKTRKLSHEILGLLGASLAVALFLFEFLSLSARSMAEDYYARQDLILSAEQILTTNTWINAVSMLTAVLFFVVLFLFLLGQQLAYVTQITRGVDALRAGQTDYVMPLEGRNELTELARAINYLSASQRQIREKELALSAEKEQLIRTLSHDIRTPLTSILAYSEYLADGGGCAPEQQEQLALIRKKALQIRDLTDILLDGGHRTPERFEDGRLLMEQLADEMSAELEDDYPFTADLRGCAPFSGTFDVQELRRIFDNLTSNVRKYACPDHPVTLTVSGGAQELTICQTNHRPPAPQSPDSHHMGLNSIRRIAHNYGGSVHVQEDGDTFAITVTLRDF